MRHEGRLLLKYKLIHAFLLVVAVFVPQSIFAKTATEIFDARSPGIVMVAALDQTDKVSAAGTGVILWDGVVVTNCHVIKGADHFKVVHQQKEYPAAIRHSDWDRDVCTLTVKGLRAPAAPLGSTQVSQSRSKGLRYRCA